VGNAQVLIDLVTRTRFPFVLKLTINDKIRYVPPSPFVTYLLLLSFFSFSSSFPFFFEGEGCHSSFFRPLPFSSLTVRLSQTFLILFFTVFLMRVYREQVSIITTE
jgi:hypothetical protein